MSCRQSAKTHRDTNTHIHTCGQTEAANPKTTTTKFFFPLFDANSFQRFPLLLLVIRYFCLYSVNIFYVLFLLISSTLWPPRVSPVVAFLRLLERILLQGRTIALQKTPGLIETINLPDTEAKVLGRFYMFNINIKKIYLSKKKSTSKWNPIEMYVLNDKLPSCWINIIALLW